jgi:phage-related protein
LLRHVQQGVSLGLPHSRPMPNIGPGCHEVRVTDEDRIWRVVYRIDSDAILIAGVFSKTTRATTKQDIKSCKKRLKVYDEAARKARKGPGP